MTKPSDLEILQAMLKQSNGHRCVTYVTRNWLGRDRCSTAWLLRQKRRLSAEGLAALSPRQDRADMIQFDLTPAGRAALEARDAG